MDVVKRHQPVFLTGAPASKEFQKQKKDWVARIFGLDFKVYVVPKQNKQDYSGPSSILVDDTIENIENWIAKGGQGILHEGCYISTAKKLVQAVTLYESTNPPCRIH